jgi:hypothetical protein
MLKTFCAVLLAAGVFAGVFVNVLVPAPVSAGDQHPLENIDEFTSQRMADCLSKENMPSFCFGEVLYACADYVRGYAHNTYPCLENTKRALQKWIEASVASPDKDPGPREEVMLMFQQAYRLCSELGRVAVELGQSRVLGHQLNCESQAVVFVASELWEAIRGQRRSTD